MRNGSFDSTRPLMGDAAIFRVINGGQGDGTVGGDGAGSTNDRLVAAAHEEVRRRSDRRLVLGPDLLAEPAWDMLLDLYLAQEAGRSVAVSSLCIAAGVPTTTALRWVRILEKEGLLLRERDRDDGRRSFVKLSAPAREKIDLLLRRAIDRSEQV